MAVQQLLDLIGNTPLVEVTRMDAGKCRLFLKMESQNPQGLDFGICNAGQEFSPAS